MSFPKLTLLGSNRDAISLSFSLDCVCVRARSLELSRSLLIFVYSHVMYVSIVYVQTLQTCMPINEHMFTLCLGGCTIVSRQDRCNVRQ